MAAPPSLAGAFQTRLIVVAPLAVAERLVGAPGASAACSERLVTLTTLFMPVVKDATSLPATSWAAKPSSPVVGSV